MHMKRNSTADHDNSYKLLFSHPQMVEDLLRGFVHEDWITTVWINRVLLPHRMPGAKIEQTQELQEVETMLAERVKDWTRQWHQEGLEQGRTEGRMEGELSGELKGERGILCRLIELKFGHVPTDVRNQIEQANREQLERYSANILHATLAEDVVAGD